jgi:F-type H+-transporting ATPase subunit b
MLIDWFTVGAQALNFGILAVLMHRFLFKPILAAIDAREQRIAAELADAAAKQAAATQQRDEFQRKNDELDQQHAARSATSTKQVEAERARLLDQARTAADALSTTRHEALQREARGLAAKLRHRAGDEVFAIARKVLGDLATVSLEERIGEVFTRRLRELDERAKALLGAALVGASEPAIVRSAFAQPPDQRAAIQNALNETFSAEIDVRFETEPALVSGIELVANGQKLGWSIAGYLSGLEASVDALLAEQVR